jgi:tetratricopeptide (TPR) repeat protein
VEAGRQAFGDLKVFERQVASYVRGFQFFMRPMATPNVPAEKTFETRPVPPAEVLAVHAMLHSVSGRKAEARSEADEAVRLDPQLALGWQALARVNSDDEKMEDAQRAAAEAVRVDARSAGAHHLLGSIAWRRGDTATAEAELARATELNDAFTVSHVMLAVLRNGLGRPNDQVVPHVRRALELEPGNAHYQLMLSSVLRDRGDAVNARRLADRALRMARTAEERASVQTAIAEMERASAARAAAREARRGAGAAPSGSAPPYPSLRARPSRSTTPRPSRCTARRARRARPSAARPRGDALRGGRGVARDLGQAAGFYEKGCEGGSAPSCHHLGLQYAAGDGVVPRPREGEGPLREGLQGRPPARLQARGELNRRRGPGRRRCAVTAPPGVSAGGGAIVTTRSISGSRLNAPGRRGCRWRAFHDRTDLVTGDRPPRAAASAWAAVREGDLRLPRAVRVDLIRPRAGSPVRSDRNAVDGGEVHLAEAAVAVEMGL